MKLGSIATAIGIVAGLWFTTNSLQATYKQFGVAERTEFTNRFAKAIEQIGSGNLDVRLGGIYLLERLARDSTADRSTVFSVLGAYVRTHSPAVEECGTQSPPTLAVDIQTILDVVGRREGGNASDRIDLSDTCLVGARLSKLQFSSVDLSRSKMRDVVADGAILENAVLEGADLRGANLSHIRAQGAIFGNADLSNAYMDDSDLRRTVFHSGTLSHASLIQTNLAHASMAYMDLSGTIYTRMTGDSPFAADSEIGPTMECNHRDKQTQWPPPLPSWNHQNCDN